MKNGARRKRRASHLNTSTLRTGNSTETSQPGPGLRNVILYRRFFYFVFSRGPVRRGTGYPLSSSSPLLDSLFIFLLFLLHQLHNNSTWQLIDDSTTHSSKQSSHLDSIFLWVLYQSTVYMISISRQTVKTHSRKNFSGCFFCFLLYSSFLTVFDVVYTRCLVLRYFLSSQWVLMAFDLPPGFFLNKFFGCLGVESYQFFFQCWFKKKLAEV